MTNPVRTLLGRVKELDEKANELSAGEVHYLAGKALHLARALEAVLEMLDEMQKFRGEVVENYDVAEWHVAQRIRTAITEHLGVEDA